MKYASLIIATLALTISSSFAQRESFDASTVRIIESKEITKKLTAPAPEGTVQRKGMDSNGSMVIILATERFITLKDVFFKLDSTELRDKASAIQLKQMADALKSKELREKRFLIEGHTCDLAKEDYNLSLSAKRAQAIKDWLVKHGIAPERLAVMGCGESEPAAKIDIKGSVTEIEAQRSNNRRVVLRELPAVETTTTRKK
jgi:outer membrane protein OmpA-like peptidoglycan-associated protein